MLLNNIIIYPNDNIKKSLQKLELNSLKSLIVVNKKKKLLGILNDADIRRALLVGANLKSKINKFFVSFEKIYYVNQNHYNFNLIRKKILENSLFIVPVVNEKRILVDYISYKDLDKKTYKSSNIPVVIVAGGEGVRMKPFTDILPKPLLPINNKTILGHIIENFMTFKIKKFYISINFKSEIMKAYTQELKNRLTPDIFTVEENLSLGTSGSLKLLQKKIKTDFFVSNCDTLVKMNYYDAYNYHKKKSNILTIIACKKNIKIPYGVLKLGKENNLKDMVEKPSSTYFINTGIYICSPKIFKNIKKNTKTDINVLIEDLKRAKLKIGVYKIDDKNWIDVGQWDEYKKSLKNINELF
jgi:dTDP-glucose pyrophosphorylase|tara:strand:- start:1108 stop:2175 length:1068 start_codon:yes stop_codon:yes gene_type:complete